MQSPSPPAPTAATTGVDIDSAALLRDNALLHRQAQHERGERRRVEAGQRRRSSDEHTRLLAAAGETLGASLDYHTTLRNLASVVVPALADWYAVDLLNEDGALQRVAVVHFDSARTDLAQELLRRFPASPEKRLGAWRVIESGEPQWAEEIDDSVLAEAAQSPEHLEILRGLGLKSFMRLPLVAHGATIGVLTLVHAESGRRYSADDLPLAQEVARRAAAAVDNARLHERLQREDRRKDEFLAMLAHELRNPLAPIRTGLAILDAAPSADTAAQTRQMMQRQLGHMVRLVDDLLDLSRITRGTIELQRERIDIAGVLAIAVETSRPLIGAAALTLDLELPEQPLWVDADATRMAQVVTNMLNNAARFTAPGGRIGLRAWAEAGDLLIEVSDTGIGIAPAMLGQIFEMFVRAEASDRHAPGGLGVGLTLSKRLVELHGGSMHAASEGQGRGSRFTVRMPLAAAAQPHPQPAAAEASARTATHLADDAGQARTGKPVRRVLVVDDNADAADSLATLLTLSGYEVRTAASGAEALQVVRGFVPDAAFLDLGLPGMSGHALARRLRAQPALSATTLIALTGWGRDEDRERSREAGFDHHLIKPAHVDAVLALLDAPRS